MRGLFNKIMNKINEIPNQAGKLTNASQSQKNNQQFLDNTLLKIIITQTEPYFTPIA